LDENLLNRVISVKKLKIRGKNWNLLFFSIISPSEAALTSAYQVSTTIVLARAWKEDGTFPARFC
jgi:hypothetical protein